MTLADAIVEFERGPYGEILSPPLVAGIHPDEALEWLERASAELGSPITAMPTKGRSREGMYTLAITHAHQHRLRLALDGALMEDPDASDLHQAVVVEGQPLSLRPVYQESLAYASFAPVLQRVGEDRWRVGLPGHGRTAEITATPGEAARQAQELYARWAESDDETWEKRTAQLLKHTPHSLLHQFWAWQLQQAGYWERGGGYLLVDLRGHGTRRLERPSGSRILRGNRVHATRVTDALARRDKIEPPWPQAAEAIAWLEQAGVAPLERAGEGWQSGPVRIAWQERGGAPWASLAVGEQGYALVVVKRKALTLYPLRRGTPVRNKKLATTALEPPLREWLGNDEGRKALAMWAVWEGKLGDGK